MIPLGLTAVEQAEFHATLGRSHSIRSRLELMTTAHRHLGILPNVSDGQVDYDADAEDVDRSASLSLLDPHYETGLDAADPSTIVAYPAMMIRIVYGARAPGGAWVDVPVFTGPITMVDRADEVLTVELQGKESLAAHAVHGSKTWPKGTLKTQIIRDLLAMIGEDRVEIAADATKTTEVLSIAAIDNPWPLANTVANEIAMDLFYDGRGVAVARKRSSASVLTIGKGGLLLAEPDAGHDALNDLVNAYRVTGQTSSGSEVYGMASAPDSYPLSPKALARNGVAMQWVREESDETATTATRAKARAQELLNEALGTDSISAPLSCLPIPHLELLDVVRVEADTWVADHTIRKMSLPLGCSEAMSIGALRRVSRAALLK